MVDPIAIGVDGGGTHLRVAVAIRQGEVLGIGTAGSGNYHNVGAEQFRVELGTGIVARLGRIAVAAAASGRRFSRPGRSHDG